MRIQFSSKGCIKKRNYTTELGNRTCVNRSDGAIIKGIDCKIRKRIKDKKTDCVGK